MFMSVHCQRLHAPLLSVAKNRNLSYLQYFFRTIRPYEKVHCTAKNKYVLTLLSQKLSQKVKKCWIPYIYFIICTKNVRPWIKISMIPLTNLNIFNIFFVKKACFVLMSKYSRRLSARVTVHRCSYWLSTICGEFLLVAGQKKAA